MNSIIKVFIVLCVLFVSSTPLLAIDKDDVESIITKSESILSEIDKNTNLTKFIPYDSYSDALLHIIYARNQLEEKQYNSAYFYATISIIKFEITTVLAEAKKYEHDALVMERDAFKNKCSGDKNASKKYIAAGIEDRPCTDVISQNLLYANLEKVGPVFRARILDKFIFTKNDNTIKDSGKQRLDRIISVLNQYPNSTAKIVSHSGDYDYKHYTDKKAKLVMKYLTDKGIDPERLESMGLGNREVMETDIGYIKASRIEIIIHGIDL